VYIELHWSDVKVRPEEGESVSESARAGGRRSTVIGLIAIVLWSAMVGLVRLVSESFGAELGAALIYTLAAGLLWVTRRPRSLRTFPRKYLVIGGALFVLYEVALSLSVGLAADATQAIEVSIVNYLWPTLTVLLSAVANRAQKTSWLIVPGAALATAGIAAAVGGEAGLDPARIVANIVSNPLPYTLALCGAVVWSVYTVFTPRISQGRDGITLFFTGVAVTLWPIYLATGALPVPSPSLSGLLALVGAAVVVGAGYACWNVGILHGDMRTISTASYTAPLLSSAVGALLLGTTLAVPFWIGVLLVVAGSLLSWWATRPATVTGGARRPVRQEGARDALGEVVGHGADEEHAQRS
jgi:drug/metabolite transporter (DMT)-like permease